MSKPRTRHRFRKLHGILLLDKASGPSSNQALQRVRHLFRADKAGHTGALDPLATGLLPICFGEATKIAGGLLGARLNVWQLNEGVQRTAWRVTLQAAGQYAYRTSEDDGDGDLAKGRREEGDHTETSSPV